MSRTFSLHTVLRMAPKDLLEKVFDDLGYFDTKIPWGLLQRHEIDPIMDYFHELSPNQRNEIEAVLRGISDLACDSGFRAILEAAPICNVFDLAESLPEELGVWGRVISVWLEHRSLFERAQVIHQVERLTWWRRRTDLPRKEPDKSAEVRQSLAAEISKLFRAQGRGKECTVEVMSRDNVDYFFAYPDDFAQHVNYHDENGKLAAAAVRQTFQVVFAFDREEGTLDTFAVKLTPREKERLEWIFATTALSHNLGKHEPEPTYQLDHLKNPDTKLDVEHSDRVRVRIRRMRLNPPRGRHVHLEVDETDSIHAAILECLNLDEIPLDRWGVSQVTLVFEFLEKGGKKSDRESIDIGYPRTGGVKSVEPDRAVVIQKYLRRWGIDRVAVAQVPAVSLGSEPADDGRSGDEADLGTSV